MFRPIPAIISFSSERVLVFIRFMWLCNDGEISLSVVLIITTAKRRGWRSERGGEGGVFFNVDFVLTRVQCSRRCLIRNIRNICCVID